MKWTLHWLCCYGNREVLAGREHIISEDQKILPLQRAMTHNRDGWVVWPALSLLGFEGLITDNHKWLSKRRALWSTPSVWVQSGMRPVPITGRFLNERLCEMLWVSRGFIFHWYESISARGHICSVFHLVKKRLEKYNRYERISNIYTSNSI